MAIPIAVNDVLQVTVEGTNERQPWAWVFHLKVTACLNAVDLIAAVVSYTQTILAALKAELTDEWQAECVKVSRVAPQPMGVIYNGFDPPEVGAVTTDGVPNQAAAVIRMQTDEPGASNRGRMYLCGIPEASTDGGQLTATPRNNIDDAMDTNFLPGFSVAGNSAVPVVFSRSLYGTDPPGHPANVDDYTALITDCNTQYNLGVIRNRRYPRNAVAP